MGKIYDKLDAYRKSDYYGFHMPGHKRNEDRFGTGLPYGIDITEIDGFDDLHHAENLLKEAQERAAALYHSEETHFLVNGSTVGILSAILGSTERGDRILVARNCHKSVYHAVFLKELEPVYVYPSYEQELQINGEVSLEMISDILEEQPDIKAVVIVSPTYDGVVSDVEGIARLVHEKGIPLIVDEAHGAHFGFHPAFPESAVLKGADVVIHSVHKTLPSLTQTALIHLNGQLVDRERIRNYLHMLQSSSPSYILMAGIDACMEVLQKNGTELFETYVQNITALRERLKGLSHLKVLRAEHFDDSKFIISVKDANITSRELSRRLLSDYHLQMEMTAGSYVLAMSSVGDTKEGLERLAGALLAIDSTLAEAKKTQTELRLPKLPSAFTSARIQRLIKADGMRRVKWEEAAGCVAAEYAYIYPPGIPFIVPGERITEEAAKLLWFYERLGFSIEGTAVENEIGVWKNG